MPDVDAPAASEALGALLDELPEDLTRLAFTHSSWVDRRPESYERLAFLGDSVLGLAVSTDLYPRFEGYGAGELTKVRAQAVSQGPCADVARTLGIPARLEAAAEFGGGRSAEVLLRSERILASVCEAVIGAVYLAFGWERTERAVVAAFAPQVEEALRHPIDFKSDLQERLARGGDTVAYEIESEEGPPHDRRFVAVATAGERELGRGEGRTKKSAEQEAAHRALRALEAGG